jgi:hypothetical protein
MKNRENHEKMWKSHVKCRWIKNKLNHERKKVEVWLWKSEEEERSEIKFFIEFFIIEHWELCEISVFKGCWKYLEVAEKFIFNKLGLNV